MWATCKKHKTLRPKDCKLCSVILKVQRQQTEFLKVLEVAYKNQPCNGCCSVIERGIKDLKEFLNERK